MSDGLAARSGRKPARETLLLRQEHGISERGFGQLGHGTVPKFKAGEARAEDGCKLNPAILNKELSLVSRVVSDFGVWGAWKLFRSK